MRKVSRYLIRILAIFTLYALSSFSSVWSQSLNVFILYGEDAVSYVEVCQGSTVAFTVEVYGGSGSGHIYTWSGDTNPTYFNDLGDLVSYKNTTPAGTYNLTVNVEDDGGFTGTANLTVVIKPSPLASIVANGLTTFCDGEMVELEETNGQTGVTYQWQRNFSNISGAINTTYDAGVSGNYRIRVTGSNGCSKLSNVISVTVNPLPSVTATNDGPVCYNGTINLTSSPGGYISYTWITDAVTPFNSTEQNPSITNVTPDNNGDYTVTVKDVNGCENTAVTSVLVHNQLEGGTIAADQTICYSADPVAFTNSVSPSGGTGAWSYAWESKEGMGTWSAISGANSLTYDVPAGLTKTTQYRRSATNSCGTVYSNVVTVTVYDDLDGGSIGSSHAVCYGGDPNAFSNDAAPSGGDGVFTYIWQSKVGAGSWTDITGATAITYDVPAGLTQTTMYRRVAMNTCGIVYSNELTITVYDAIDGGVIADNQFVCYGGDPDAFTDVTSPSGGNGAWSYAWQSKVGAGLWGDIGVTTLTYDIPAGITQTTIFRRVSSNLCGSANSNELTVTVYPQMNGGTISGDQSLCYNSDPTEITSTAVPSGGNGPWTYSWEYQVNCAGPWATVAGASGLSFDPPANQTETRCYRRVAVNDCGTVYSNIITITIHADIDGGTIAADRTVCYGGDPDAFTSSASASGGNGAFTYFWQQNTGSGWNDITGASGLTYDVTAGITQTTQYRRGATNLCGTGYSNILTVTVSDDIEGGQISSPGAVCYNGDPDAFTDVTSPSGGAGIWAYTWEYRVGMGSWNVIGGANGSTYDIPAGQTETRTYRRVATNDCGIGYSNEVTVVVYNNTVAGTISGDQSICYNGDPAVITSSALPTGGDASWTYSWEYQTNCAGGWIAIVGANGLTYDPPANQTETRCYRRVEVNSCGTVYTNTITITIFADISGGTIAADQTVCNGGDPAAFTSSSAASGGNGAFTYFWQRNTGSGWTNITGASALTYDVPVGITQTTEYRRGATNLCGTGYSNTITVTVSDIISGGQISSPAAVCHNGDPAAFTDIISPSGGNGVWFYSWEYRVGLGSWNIIVGANALTYDIPAGQTDTRTYRRVATNDCGTGYSNEVTVVVYDSPVAGSITGNQTLCFDGDPDEITSVSLPSGGSAGWTYAWEYQSNCAGVWTAIAGANATSYNPPANQTETRCYRRVETNACGTIYSNTVTITIIPVITGNTISADQVICSGSTPAQLTGPEPTGGSGVYTYQWQHSTTSASGPFTDISGAQSQNYSPLSLTQTTYYQRMVTSGPCSDYSNAVTVEVNPPISNNTIAAAQTICYNTTPAELSGSAPTGGNGAYTYQWQSSTVGAGGPFGDILGATNANYQPGNLTQDTWFRRSVTSLPCTDNISNVIKITVSPEFTVTGITSVSPTCNGYNNGSATVNTAGGIAPYTYSWNTTPVQTNQTATGLLAGVNYSVTVTDAALCVVTDNITLTEPAAISLGSVTANPVTGCFGDTNGSIQITGTGGTPNYTYTLYLGATLIATQTPVHPASADFTGLATGTYSVNITDINGCPEYIESNIVVSEPPQLLINDVIITDVVCHGESTGTLTIMATGGTGAITYSISGELGTYLPTNFFDGLPSGDYDIWVKDANGCTANWGIVFIASPEAISVSASFKVITSCHNDNTGEITISPYPGALTDYDYTLAQFPTPADWGSSNVYLGLAAGNYYPQVRQISSGCVAKLATSPIIITQPDPIDFTVIKVDVTTCSYNTNGSIRVQGVSGGTGPYKTSRDNVQWFNTPYTFTGLGVDNYEILVRDSKGCIVKKDVALTGPAPIVVTSLTSTDPTCFGATNGTVSVAATGGTGDLEYSIDDVTYIKIVAPATQAVFNGLKAGMEYTVYIKDANGCINQDTKITLSQPLVLYFTQQDVTPITCNTANDGKITLAAAGGNPPYSYTITAGAITFTDPTGVFINLPAGKYTVSVTDLNGCVTVGTDLTVEEPDPITITGQSSTDILCHGETNGTITVSATGGTSPLVYNLYTGAVLVASNGDGKFTGLGMETYTVEVTDANGCGPKLVGSFNIDEPALLEFTYTTVDLTCYNDGTGQITVNATGGIFPYAYSFDGGTNFDVNNIQGGLNGGDYTVIVRDANQCSSTQVVKINAPDELILTLDVTNISCGGLSDGKIVANAIGGSTTTPYQYRINTGAWQLDNTFTGLNADTYTIEVLDDKGCTDTETGVIAEPVPVGLDPTSATVNPTCTTLGSITAVGTGGTAPYTYTLNPGTPDEVVNTSGTFENLAIGSYIVHINDVYNCGPFIWNVDLTGPPTLTISATPTSILCNGGTSTITITAIGGTAPFQYSIDDQVTYIPDNNVFPGLVAGTYEVWVKDANNCTAHATVNITQPDALVLGTPVIIQESGVGTNDGSISVTATGGTGVLTYTLTPLGTTNNTGTFTGLGAGTYRVSVTDENGCSAETADLVIGGMSIDLTLTHLTCNASNNGSIKIVINGGILPYNVLCTLLPLPGTPITVSPTADPKEFIAEALAAGEYNITVADNIGNIRSQQVQILEPAPLVVTLIQKINPSCNGDTGSIIFDIDGGIPVSIVGSDSLYTIDLIRDGAVVASITDTVVTGILPNVKYDFKISDANSCSVLVDTIQPLTEPEAIVVAGFTKEDIQCNGQAQGKITITASGGAGNLTYKLVDPVSGITLHENSTGEFLDLVAGSYNLVVEDINTCSATVDFNPIVLTEPTAIMISGGEFPTDSLQCPYSIGGYVRNINVTGGTPFATGDGYLYLWTNGLTTKDVEDLTIGIHTLTVTDGNGCKQTQDYPILGPDTLELERNIVAADCKLLWARTNPGETEITDIGQITISNSKGGNGSFSDLKFLWNYPESNPSTSNVLSKLSGGTYTLKVTDKKLCEYTFDYIVPLNPRYDYTVDPGADTTVCYNNPVILHGEVTGGDPGLTFTYNWFLVPETDGQPLHVGKDLVITTTGSKKYLLEVVDSDGACKDTSYIDVSVLPEIGLHVPLYVSAVQDTIISVLMGKEFNLDVITKSVEYETEFQWKPAEMFMPSNSWNSNIIFNEEIKQQIPADRFVTLQDPLTRRYSDYILVDVIAKTSLGCTDSIRLYTKIVTDLAFGNVFSPNGDGINDIWSVPKDYLFPDLEIEIFNRWGSLVWSAKGDKAARGWNGRTNNGNELPIGTYYYVVKFNAKAQGSGWKPITGSVTIVK